MDHNTEVPIGQRIQEIRRWRGLSLRAAAGLACISHGYLGQLERGLKPVNNRQLLERIARALKVHPADLAGRPYVPVDETTNTSHAALDAVESILTEWWPGEVPDDAPARQWGAVSADYTQLVEQLRPNSQYAAMGNVIPDLIHDLLIHAEKDSEHREEALRALIVTYHAAGRLTSALGADHLGYLAAERVTQSANILGEPDWLGVAAWTRAQYISSLSRRRQYELAVSAAELPSARLETRGMSHLTAALACAARGDGDQAQTHLNEAAAMADAIGLPTSPWGAGTMHFGQTNVGIWRVSIGVELGAGAGIAEIARDVQWQSISVSRQGAYWMEYGRGLLEDRGTRQEGLEAILKAEELTPQQVRANAFVREAVSSILTVARRDAGGREVRGLAYRMGIAPIG